jgi:hypothetical protein
MPDMKAVLALPEWQKSFSLIELQGDKRALLAGCLTLRPSRSNVRGVLQEFMPSGAGGVFRPPFRAGF